MRFVLHYNSGSILEILTDVLSRFRSWERSARRALLPPAITTLNDTMRLLLINATTTVIMNNNDETWVRFLRRIRSRLIETAESSRITKAHVPARDSIELYAVPPLCIYIYIYKLHSVKNYKPFASGL